MIQLLGKSFGQEGSNFITRHRLALDLRHCGQDKKAHIDQQSKRFSPGLARLCESPSDPPLDALTLNHFCPPNTIQSPTNRDLLCAHNTHRRGMSRLI